MVADPADAVLLEVLSDGPATAVDLAARLALMAGVALPNDADLGIAARLQDWLRNGWVDLMDV